jgi:diguanylate cyclase (GGDEF)-like protein
MSRANVLRLRPLAAVALVALALAHGLARADDLAARMDELVHLGDENPKEAIASLEQLAGADAGPSQRRMRDTAIGLVAARNGWETEANARIDALATLARAADPLAEADAHLVRAVTEDNAGHGEASYQAAREALRGYAESCDAGPAQRPDCDYRHRWRALHLAEAGAEGQGNFVVASSFAQQMLDVARAAGDRQLEAVSTAVSALVAEADADPTTANRLMAQSQRLARIDGSPWLEARVGTYSAELHRMRKQLEATAHDWEDVLATARTAGLARIEMQVRADLSDVYILQNRPADALAQIKIALPAARARHDLRFERVLLHNATLAHLALGRVAEAKAELAHVLELWERDVGPGKRAEALNEFSEALEKAGDSTGAIDLFHKEEALQEEIRAANKRAAEADMRARYDREAQQRRIELLARDNQLKSADLENQVLARRLWMFAGAAMALMGVLAMLMYLRMREVNRALVRHEALLRAHSERDALTGLANRRQFREVMRARGGASFSGALLMVDVDHFKRINDVHGHAAGDRVLVEVGRRLASAVRGADLVARWGGEEFLVFAPGVEGPELDQLAERVRVAINEAPIALDGGAPLPVTVSIGYASFPLPDSRVPVSWEQAVNLADLSLYTAKNHGRDCAVGIARTTAATADALREVEADLARAHEEGRVTLRVMPVAREHPPLAEA